MPSMRSASAVTMHVAHGFHEPRGRPDERRPGVAGAAWRDAGGYRCAAGTGPRGSVALKVPVNGTPIGPAGMYTTV
jgi:hypothetical protein